MCCAKGIFAKGILGCTGFSLLRWEKGSETLSCDGEKGSETPSFLMLRPRERGSLRPFSPSQGGSLRPFFPLQKGKPRTSQNPLSENPLSATHELTCFKEQLTCNLDLVPVWVCLVPVLPFFYSFHCLSAGFPFFLCRFSSFLVSVFALLSAGFALFGERERRIETVRKPSPSCPLKHANASILCGLPAKIDLRNDGSCVVSLVSDSQVEFSHIQRQASQGTPKGLRISELFCFCFAETTPQLNKKNPP